MKNLMLLIILIVLNLRITQSQTVINWDSVGQEVKLLKTEDYVFNYNIKKIPCYNIQVKEKGIYQYFKLINNCVTDSTNSLTLFTPDTLFVDCDGTIKRSYLNDEEKNSLSYNNLKNQKIKVIKWEKYGQTYKINNCEIVNFIYTNEVTPDDADFIYEQISDGYLLTVKMRGSITELNFDCICKRYEVANPYSYRIKISHSLRYEQLIMTPIDNDIWEVRIGTTDIRNCDSEARFNLKFKRTNEYEKLLPRDCE